MSHGFTPITDNLYLFEDTCNVYAVRRGEEALLVDFGSGEVLHHLKDIGVSRVVAILHTHHHRDQAQGDGEAAARGIPIHVPVHERHLFDQVEIYWSTKQLYDMYNVRNTYFTLTKSVPVAGVLADYERFEWKGVSFEIVPTPGHSVGSVSLLGRVGAALVAFTGDLIHSPGKVLSMYDMQYNYGATDGVEAAVLSLCLLEERKPDLLCPSHGEPMRDAPGALAATEKNLRAFYRLQSGGKLLADEVDFTPVASRLLHASRTCSSFYVLLSRDGKRALFVDYGAPNFALFQPVTMHFESGERVRFVQHSLRRLREQYGVQKVEAVIPSHYHDDHINGIPYLQRHLGTEVWAYENMKEILENPTAELIGCVLPDPIPVARTFADGERFSWEGLSFDVHFTPGHCDYHMAMFTEMDGKRIAFSGDNISLPNVIPSLIYRNHVHRTSHRQTAELFRERRPQVLCSGHALFTNVDPEGYDTFYANASRLTELFETLLPKESGILGIEPSWLQIVPYQIKAEAGARVKLEVRVRNPLAAPARVEVSWVLPEGWSTHPATAALDLAADSRGSLSAELLVPKGYVFRYPKLAVSLEATLNGKRLGQVAEAVVEHVPYGPAGAR